ncbi:hypothetical protein C0Q70_02347 [Pomacea canaliculata]|uniref:cellulase n=1 Tax=Pomacea canaliculata TaxID=400727 RepID=A0A2T7PPQ0_POMCA|nr:hypothetical protein C0Q70_02347 [Pomacea canaliculata]
MLTLILLAALPLMSLGNVVVPVSNHWSGGFQGKACFTIDSELTSWHMHLIFDQPIQSLDVWTADVETSTDDKTEWILDSKTWNAVEHVGQELCVDFMGHGERFLLCCWGPRVHLNSFSPTLQPPACHLSFTISCSSYLLAPTSGGNGIEGTTRTASITDGRFEEWLTFQIDKPITGWIVRLTCEESVDSLSASEADTKGHDSDKTQWQLVANDAHMTLQPGPFEMKVDGSLVDSSASDLQCSAVLIDLGVDKNDCGEVPNTGGSKYNYDELLMKSIMFYEAQRSGKLPATNRIPWRGDSGLQDRGTGGEDLTGGWYDGGGYVKFTLPTAWSTVILTWGLLEFRDAYEAAGQVEWMYDCIKWPLDYLLKCHSSDNVVWVQVGDGMIDQAHWGRPEDMAMSRPSFKVDSIGGGADVAMEMAAAFASGYLAFRERDAEYAETLLHHAQTVYDYGIKHPGVSSQWIIESQGYYNSWDYNDDICWGSLWMYKATNKNKYMTEALKYCHITPYAWEMDWNHVFLGSQILLYQVTKQETYKKSVEAYFQHWFPNGTILITPKGLGYKEIPGSLRYAANMALAALMAAEAGIHPDEYRHWAMCQIHYSLGDAGHSYVVGFGENPPVSPHHRSSSCPSPPASCTPSVLHAHGPNPHVLCGALVGGPDGRDGYKDDREEYYYNDIAIVYNAGFQTAVAALRSLLLRHLHPEQTGQSTCPYTSPAP